MDGVFSSSKLVEHRRLYLVDLGAGESSIGRLSTQSHAVHYLASTPPFIHFQRWTLDFYRSSSVERRNVAKSAQTAILFSNSCMIFLLVRLIDDVRTVIFFVSMLTRCGGRDGNKSKLHSKLDSH